MILMIAVHALPIPRVTLGRPSSKRTPLLVMTILNTLGGLSDCIRQFFSSFVVCALALTLTSP
jgi:hypothetical protein